MALGAILALALALRLAAIPLTHDYVPVLDSADYARHAVSIAHGDGFPQSPFTVDGGPSAFRPPLYPYLLGAVYAIAGDQHGLDLARVVGAVIGVLVVYLIYRFGELVWGRAVGLVAAAIAAVFPPLVFLNAALLTEPLFLALELGIVVAALLARRRPQALRWAIVAGVLCGLAALTRSNGLLLAPIAIAGVWTGRPRFSRAALMAPLALIAALAATLGPWAVRNALVLDHPVVISTQGGVALAGIFNDEAREFPGHPGTWLFPGRVREYRQEFARAGLDESGLDRGLRDQAVSYAVDHPLYVAEETALNALRILDLVAEAPVATEADRLQLGLTPGMARVGIASFFVLALISLAGVVALAARPRGRRGPRFVWVLPVVLVLAAAGISGSSRYRVPAYPFMAVLGAVAIVDGARRLNLRGAGAGAAPAATPIRSSPAASS